jgi:hypothetical protein
MITKSEIYQAVSYLLESAKNRDTSQGVLVYTKFLDMIDAAQDDKAVRELLVRLNRSLAGIEAHGDFTDEEFKRVLFLRKGEG